MESEFGGSSSGQVGGALEDDRSDSAGWDERSVWEVLVVMSLHVYMVAQLKKGGKRGLTR